MTRRRRPSAEPPALNLDFVNAVPVLVRTHAELRLWLVGCGGTGSFLAGSLARLARAAADRGKRVRLVFVDPDRVEEKNVPRQNFCEAEIGSIKSEALARRYASAWGLDIAAVPEEFAPSMLGWSGDGLTVIVGAVDNAAARRAMHKALATNSRSEVPTVWQVDSGNRNQTGQVLVGAATAEAELKRAWDLGSAVTNLPAPALQCPDLLVPQPEELEPERMSCAELLQANLQSLNINARVAAEAADVVTRLVLTGDLRRFATYLDLESGSARSRYTAPDAVARALREARHR